MMTFTQLAPAPSDPAERFTDRLAVAAYLARFKGSSREHTESDLRCYLAWCAERGLDPLAARRPHLELYIRWMKGIRRFQPSTVSRGSRSRPGSTGPAPSTASWSTHPPSTSAAPPSPAGSPTLGFTHLQFEALLTAARQSPNPYDFALVAMLGLLSLRILRPPAQTSPTSAKSTATGSCGYAARAPRSSWSRCPQLSASPSTRRPEPGREGRSCSTAVAPGWTGTRQHAACTDSPRPPASRSPERTRTCSDTLSSRPCSARESTCVMSRLLPVTQTPRTTMRYDRARQNLDRHPNYILAAYMASGT